MTFEDWGLIDYESSMHRQLLYVDEISAGARDESLIFCTHPPVVTLGRATVAEDIQGWSGATFESSRGGRATYHGPSQVVIYPILDLKVAHAHFAARDIHSYLRALERATVSVLHETGLAEAEARTAPLGETSLTGVWLGERKLASIGIAVRKWVTYHGVAINVLRDPLAFQGIRPCGFQASVMSSLEQELKRPVDITGFNALAQRIFMSVLS